MKKLIRLMILSGLVSLVSGSAAVDTASKKTGHVPAGNKSLGIFAVYDWITEGTGVEYRYVGGDAGAPDPKVNLWSGGSSGVPPMPAAVGKGERHGQIGGWASLTASPAMNWSAYSTGTLKLHLCVSDNKPVKIAFKSEDPAIGEWSVWIAPGEEKYGLVRGTDWSEVAIPLSEFSNNRSAELTPKNLSRIKDPFVISGGATFVFSQIYLSEQ
jgi:hypothetical protein